MRELIIVIAASLALGCGFKKEAAPAEQDTARHEESKPVEVQQSKGMGTHVRTGGVKANLDNVMEESKQERDKRVNEIFDQ